MQNVRSFQPSLRKHADGSVCLEGTRMLPAGFVACCTEFEQRTAACVFDVRYEWHEKLSEWLVAIPQVAGGGGIAIKHCPHCGTKIAGQKV